MPIQTYAYTQAITSLNNTTLQIFPIQNVKSIDFSFYSALTLDTDPTESGSLTVTAIFSEGSCNVYYGPVIAQAYGAPICLFSSDKPFTVGPNIGLTFNAFMDDGTTTSPLTGRYYLRLTVDTG